MTLGVPPSMMATQLFGGAEVDADDLAHVKNLRGSNIACRGDGDLRMRYQPTTVPNWCNQPFAGPLETVTSAGRSTRSFTR